ncbi:hypothetical protein ABIA32_005152 [Streptacidiphilus sp. MAP12-20]
MPELAPCFEGIQLICPFDYASATVIMLTLALTPAG